MCAYAHGANANSLSALVELDRGQVTEDVQPAHSTLRERGTTYHWKRHESGAVVVKYVRPTPFGSVSIAVSQTK